MDPLSVKGSVDANNGNGRLSTAGPSIPQCRHSFNDSHGRTRLKTRQNEIHGSSKKDLDLGRDHMAHENSAKREEMAYQNDSYTDSSHRNNAETSTYPKKHSSHPASSCHFRRRFNRALQHTVYDSDSYGKPQVLSYRPQSQLKQNQGEEQSAK